MSEIIVTILILLLLGALVFPFPMPTSLLMTIVVALAVGFVIFASFVWRERPRDEREEQHRALAGRVGFIIGSGILVIGIIVQSMSHALDVWMVATLAGLLLGKTAGLIYAKTRQ